MYAVIETGGKQYKVEAGQELYIEKLNVEGESITFDNVLMLIDGEAVTVGTPNVAGATVEAKIVKNGKAKKVIVFKFKAKKNYRRRQGHRQPYTKLQITKISA